MAEPRATLVPSDPRTEGGDRSWPHVREWWASGELRVPSLVSPGTNAIDRRTVLYRAMKAHWRTFVAELEAAADSRALLAFVVAEVEAFLNTARRAAAVPPSKHTRSFSSTARPGLRQFSEPMPSGEGPAPDVNLVAS
jgi:hypothetical protein